MTLTREREDNYIMAFETKIEKEDKDFYDPSYLPKLDAELLRKHVDWAKKSQADEPVELEWQQNHWLHAPDLTPKDLNDVALPHSGMTTKEPFSIENFCGTGGCLAGSVALQFGEPIWYNDSGPESKPKYLADDVLVDGEVWNISDFAMNKLGLTDVEASFMFFAGAKIEQIEYIAQRACQRRGIRW